MESIVFISDLHLSIGGNHNIERFHAGRELEALLQVPELTPKDPDRARLVLLGDSFDIWRTALDDAEYAAADTSDIPVDFTAASEINRLDRISQGHPSVFQALAKFVSRPNCALIVMPGNHDHSLVDGDVQKHVRSLLGDRDNRIEFCFHYDAPDFALYAIHGNQGDDNNRYQAFNCFSWQTECAGYYFVRLFLNRLETLEPDLDDSPGGWRSVWHYLRNALKPSLLAAAIKFWVQYRRDRRVSSIVSLGEDVAVDGPDLLVTGESQNGNIFSNIPEVEQAFRLEYNQHSEVQKIVDELRHGSEPIPPPELTRMGVENGLARTGRNPASMVSLGDQEELDYVEQTFRTIRERENSVPYRYLLMGHTHKRLERQVNGSDWYFNTGTWSGNIRGRTLTVAVAQRDNGGARTALGKFENQRLELGEWR